MLKAIGIKWAMLVECTMYMLYTWKWLAVKSSNQAVAELVSLCYIEIFLQREFTRNN